MAVSVVDETQWLKSVWLLRIDRIGRTPNAPPVSSPVSLRRASRPNRGVRSCLALCSGHRAGGRLAGLDQLQSGFAGASEWLLDGLDLRGGFKGPFGGRG